MIVLIILLLYILLLLLVMLGMHAVTEIEINKQSKNTFSILVPFKNEAENLTLLLKSLKKLNYPSKLFEIIMIDDDSDDDSVSIIQRFDLPNITILSTKNTSKQGKKEALEKGINHAKHDWIITTDADCHLPAEWLCAYNSIISQTDAKMVLAPVAFFDDSTFLGQLQHIEFLSLQAMTMASCAWSKPFLSNGANIGFLKTAFQQVNGYEGNKHIASGDDVFLLEKFHKTFPGKIKYLKTKSALVKTQTQKNWYNLLQQKTRWGTKTKHFQSILPKLIGGLVLLTNFLIFICFIVGFKFPECFWLIFIKLLMDYIYITYINQFFQISISLINIILVFFYYPLYLIRLAVFSIKNKPQWKGREI